MSEEHIPKEKTIDALNIFQRIENGYLEFRKDKISGIIKMQKLPSFSPIAKSQTVKFFHCKQWQKNKAVHNQYRTSLDLEQKA